MRAQVSEPGRPRHRGVTSDDYLVQNNEDLSCSAGRPSGWRR